MLPLVVTYIQNNLSSKGRTLGFPNSESPDCGQWQHSPTILLKTLSFEHGVYQEYVTSLMGTHDQPRRHSGVYGRLPGLYLYDVPYVGLLLL
eukprot:scaffold46664_cov63-Attheya_sp.AAC.3